MEIPSKNCPSIFQGNNNKKSDLCPGPGFYPDPTNCNRYNYCDHEKRAISYICPHHYIYDPTTALCKLHRTINDCHIIDCMKFPNQFVVYPLDRTLYIFCNADIHGQTRALLYQCTGETIFNPLKKDCDFACIEGEGRFEYPGDNQKYYYCVRTIYGTILPFVMRCGSDLKFLNGRCSVAVNAEVKIETTTNATTTETTLGHAIAYVPINVTIPNNLKTK